MLQKTFSFLSSYPTYEEWKQTFHIHNYFHLFVLILPMRNGNVTLFSVYHILIFVLILPMRNGNRPSSMIFKVLARVLILPMRNGNYTKCPSLLRYTNRVLILPMRNGNFQPRVLVDVLNILCSYPTYEEWKQISIASFMSSIVKCSYPTYEEWKPRQQLEQKPFATSCSYPTYEEWKRITP